MPLLDRLGQSPVQEKVFAPLLDPGAEPIPLCEDRFVGDLDCRRPRHRIPVEGEEAMLAVAGEDLVERLGVELQLA